MTQADTVDGTNNSTCIKIKKTFVDVILNIA